MISKLQKISLVLFIIFGAIFLYTESKDISIKNFFLPGTPILKIGEIPMRVHIANTEAERTQGLSGKESLGNVDGILFVFDEADYHKIWMKDMNFPIDIIWIGEDLTVINIEKNVRPDSYPRTFRAIRPARYAVETNIHYSDTFDFKEGMKVRLPANYLED